jgi:hypothetical protein
LSNQRSDMGIKSEVKNRLTASRSSKTTSSKA